MKIIILRILPSGTEMINEIEITSYEWQANHKFAYVRKHSNRYETLEPDQELIGLFTN